MKCDRIQKIDPEIDFLGPIYIENRSHYKHIGISIPGYGKMRELFTYFKKRRSNLHRKTLKTTVQNKTKTRNKVIFTASRQLRVAEFSTFTLIHDFFFFSCGIKIIKQHVFIFQTVSTLFCLFLNSE